MRQQFLPGGHIKTGHHRLGPSGLLLYLPKNLVNGCVVSDKVSLGRLPNSHNQDFSHTLQALVLGTSHLSFHKRKNFFCDIWAHRCSEGVIIHSNELGKGPGVRI